MWSLWLNSRGHGWSRNTRLMLENLISDFVYGWTSAIRRLGGINSLLPCWPSSYTIFHLERERKKNTASIFFWYNKSICSVNGQSKVDTREFFFSSPHYHMARTLSFFCLLGILSSTRPSTTFHTINRRAHFLTYLSNMYIN